MLKTHDCGELRQGDVGRQVTLAGWVDRRRDHGGLIFIDLRDRGGLTQVVFNPQFDEKSHRIGAQMRSEYVIRVTGEVGGRPRGTENPKLATGDIEVLVRDAAILNTSLTPPFYINEDIAVEESLSLKYRYLDLRRKRLRDNIVLRHRATKYMRDFLDSRGFLEVETPILIKSTPEGARDYLVPSRIYPGKFYALPQSPQQLKQLLMVAGIEKYFQIAKCFRDEDTRADRQPEFTQLDLEMSFLQKDDMLDLVEALVTGMVAQLRPDVEIIKPFPRLSYGDALERYGSDKPDLRFGLEIRDVTDVAGATEFGVFRSAVGGGGIINGICAPGCGNYSRSQLDELNNLARTLGAAGVVTVSLGASPGRLDDLVMEEVRSVAAKFLTLAQVKQIAGLFGASKGDLLLLVAGGAPLVHTVLGELRKEFGRRLKLARPNVLAFAYIENFPLLRWNTELKRWQSEHHPFTLPLEEDMALLDSAPERVRGQHYDLVCNGLEIGGGSLRIYTHDLQQKLFRLLGYSDEQSDALFGHLIEAFQYGAPPHGGIALGIDRLVMLLAGEETIRAVIAFPKNQSGVDLTLNAPAAVTEQQLADLHLEIRRANEDG